MHVKQLTGPHIAAIRPTIEKNEVESQGERTTAILTKIIYLGKKNHRLTLWPNYFTGLTLVEKALTVAHHFAILWRTRLSPQLPHD
jgi:hypothetical protein